MVWLRLANSFSNGQDAGRNSSAGEEKTRSFLTNCGTWRQLCGARCTNSFINGILRGNGRSDSIFGLPIPTISITNHSSQTSKPCARLVGSEDGWHETIEGEYLIWS